MTTTKLPIKRSLLALLLVLVAGLVLAGCKYLPAKTIDNPSEGSPEWLVWKFLEGALKSETSEAWSTVRPLMHSIRIEMRNSEEGFVNDNFTSFRRKIQNFTTVSGKPDYELKYTEDVVDDKEVILFVMNAGSDMPSPFRIARDPKASNEWRIKNIP
jgi:hypothetical protein